MYENDYTPEEQAQELADLRNEQLIADAMSMLDLVAEIMDMEGDE